MDGWVNRWMGGWMDGEWCYCRTGNENGTDLDPLLWFNSSGLNCSRFGWMDGWVGELVDGWVGGLMDGWIDGWMGG
jgi:hypothetical protein